ncbi:MAG: hypothetical protein IJI19_10095 [Ruminococcus sp.]|nr:hypothetical protein [Ruminococcus sp.]
MNPLRIRHGSRHGKLQNKILITLLFFLLGFLLGLMAKWLNTTAPNALPQIVRSLDLRNLFARTPVWVLIALAITLFSRNPRRASLNVLLFLVGVIGSYCLFSYLWGGRLPDQHNLLLWGIVTAASALAAFGVWYARCRGLLGTAISAVIIAYFILQIFSFTANFSHFDLSYGLAEVFILIAVIMMLYDGIVSCLISVGAAIALAYLVKLTGFSIPYVL